MGLVNESSSVSGYLPGGGPEDVDDDEVVVVVDDDVVVVPGARCLCLI